VDLVPLVVVLRVSVLGEVEFPVVLVLEFEFVVRFGHLNHVDQ